MKKLKKATIKKVEKLKETKIQKIFIKKRKYEVTKEYYENKVMSSKVKYRILDKLKTKYKKETKEIRQNINFKIKTTIQPHTHWINTDKKENVLKSKLYVSDNFTINKPYGKNMVKLINSKTFNNLTNILLTIKIQSKYFDIDEEKINNNPPIYITRTFKKLDFELMNIDTIQETINGFILKNSFESFVSDNNKILGVFIRFIYANT